VDFIIYGMSSFSIVSSFIEIDSAIFQPIPERSIIQLSDDLKVKVFTKTSYSLPNNVAVALTHQSSQASLIL